MPKGSKLWNLGRSKVVYNFLADPEAYGTVKLSRRSKATNARTRLVNAASNSIASCLQIVGNLWLTCSPMTVRRVLHDSGVIVMGQITKYLDLTERHKITRFSFAEEKLT